MNKRTFGLLSTAALISTAVLGFSTGLAVDWAYLAILLLPVSVAFIFVRAR